MMASLHDRTVSSIFWSLLQKVGSRGITFVVTLILARILTPRDFGLIGMLMVFIAVSQTLVQAGFNQALIQKKSPDEEDFSSVFYINLCASAIIYLVLYFSAPLIGEFYGQEALVDLTRVLSLIFVINAFSYVQEAKLMKEMRFKTLAIIHIPASLIAGIVSVVMAKMGWGVWSIVFLQVVQRLAYAIQIWIYSRWKPLLKFNFKKAKSLFSFGSKLMITGVIRSVFDNMYLIVIGKFFPVNMVGYYQNANMLVKQPVQTFSSSLSSVTFSAFSAVQEDDQKLKVGYKKTIRQLLFWVCPVFVLSGVLATPLFSLFLTDKWLPSVPYFQILCVVGILYPLNAFNLNIVNVKGRSDLFLKLAIIKRSIMAVSIIIAVPLGIWYLLIFQAVNAFIGYYLNSFYSGKYINYSLSEQIRDIYPIIMLSIAIGAGVFVLDKIIFNVSDILRLIFGFGLGGGIYWFIAKQFEFSAYRDFVNIISYRRKRMSLKQMG